MSDKRLTQRPQPLDPEALLRGTTKGPWLAVAEGNFVTTIDEMGEPGSVVAEVPCQSGNPHDLALLAASWSLAARLIEVERLMREVLAIKWRGRLCRYCDGLPPDHDSECWQERGARWLDGTGDSDKEMR